MLQKRSDKDAVAWCYHCKGGLSYPYQGFPDTCPHCNGVLEYPLWVRPKKDPRRVFVKDDRQQGPL